MNKVEKILAFADGCRSFAWHMSLILLLAFAGPSFGDPQGQETGETQDCSHYIFYRCDGIGAHAFYRPHIMVLESGMEAVYYRRIDKYPYARGFKNTVYSILNADKVIHEYGGYDKFFRDQFLPQKTGAFAPNWGWHLLGGGFRARMLEEYYVDNGVANPRLWSWLTLYVGHLGNEAAQAEKADQGTVDAIADLMFFDWVGKLLFTHDGVARFFSQNMNLKEWTYQMSYDPRNNRLVNNGQQYWLRVPLMKYFSVSMLTGNMHNSVSFTVNNDAQQQWTLGVGLKPEAITWNKKEARSNATSYSIMMAYSENDNPLVNVFLQDNTNLVTSAGGELNEFDDISKSRKLVVNIYPKWININKQKFGMTFGYLYGGYFLGFTTGDAPLGLVGHTGAESRFRDDF